MLIKGELLWKPGKTVYEVISGGKDIIRLGGREVECPSAYCSRFNFQGGDQQKKVDVLSGGRAQSCSLGLYVKIRANVLLLDEQRMT
jgi:ATPase subunit of ABC transporter with duplicated ATPase domains